MIAHKPKHLKKLLRWLLLILYTMVASYLGFIFLVSVWTGFKHIRQYGFWVPVLAGMISFIFVLFLFIRITKPLLGQLKQKDLFNF